MSSDAALPRKNLLGEWGSLWCIGQEYTWWWLSGECLPYRMGGMTTAEGSVPPQVAPVIIGSSPLSVDRIAVGETAIPLVKEMMIIGQGIPLARVLECLGPLDRGKVIMDDDDHDVLTTEIRSVCPRCSWRLSLIQMNPRIDDHHEVSFFLLCEGLPL